VKIEKAYSQLAYQLIYPGVLGSMIFDIADPMRSFTTVTFISVLIALCFVVDYLHMTLNLCEDGVPSHKAAPFIDICIAFLFCFSYFSLSKTGIDNSSGGTVEAFLRCLGFLLLGQAFIIFYELMINSWSFGRLDKLDVVVFIVILLGIISVYLNTSSFESVHIVLGTISMMTLMYLYRTFRYKADETLLTGQVEL